MPARASRDVNVAFFASAYMNTDCMPLLVSSGSVFSSGLDLEEHAPTFMEMTSSAPVGDTAKDPARKAFEIARFVSGMQESLTSLDRYGVPRTTVSTTCGYGKSSKTTPIICSLETLSHAAGTAHRSCFSRACSPIRDHRVARRIVSATTLCSKIQHCTHGLSCYIYCPVGHHLLL